MTTAQAVNIGVAHQIGRYADAVYVPAGMDQIVVSGTPGLRDDGTLPDGIVGQATQAWKNVEAILGARGFALADIVSVRQWLTSADDVADYVGVRSSVIKHETASMLAVVPGLVWRGIAIEIEVIAARRPAVHAD